MTGSHRQPGAHPPLWDDPVVEEIRAIRRKIWDAAGHDIHQFLEQTRRVEDRRRAMEQHSETGQ
jgi:hypothetical protein